MFFSRLSKNRCRQGDTSQVRTILCVKKTRWKWHTLNRVISRTSQGATKPLPGWFGLAGKQNGFKQTSGKKCASQKFALNCLSLSSESHVGSPKKTANVSNIFPTEKYVQKRTIVACVSSESHFRRTTKKVDFSLHGQYNDRCKHIYLRCIAIERFGVSDWSWLWSCPMFRSRECQTQCCHGAGVGRPAGPPPPSSIKNECGISPCKPFILLILQRQWHLSSKLGSKQQQSYKSGESCLYNVSHFFVIHFGVGIFGAIPTGWFQGSLILKPSKMLNCKIKLCYHFYIDTKSIIRGPN